MKPGFQRALTVAVSAALSLALAVWLYARISPEHAKVELGAPKGGVFHVYVLGGSTAAGVPYDGAFDIGSLTAYLLGGEIDSRTIEVKHLAFAGKDTTGVLADAREIAKSAHERGSAIALLYSGDNEFLKYGGHPNVVKSERRLFDVPVVDHETHDVILHDYGSNVEEIQRVLDGAGVELYICTGAINLGDREPNRSVLDDPGNEARVRGLLDRAEEKLAGGEREAALGDLSAAIAIEPHFAWTRKRAGDVLRSLGRLEEARVEYQACVDWDGAPLSFTTQLNEKLRDAAHALRAPLVDLEPELQRASRDGLPGYDLFWDHCHPTLEGFTVMASAIARTIEERHHVEPRVKDPDRAAVESAFHIDRSFMVALLVDRGTNMYGSALLTWNPKQRLARSHLYLDRAVELAPEDGNAACAQAILSLIEGDTPTSRKWWKRAIELNPKLARRRLAVSEVGLMFKAQGVDDPQSMFEH